MENNGKISLFSNLILFLMGATFVILPMIFASNMTDPIQLPKKVLIVAVALIGVVLWLGAQTLQKFILLRKNASDMPLFLYIFILAVAAGFSVYMSSSILWAAPVVGIVIIGFLMSQITKSESDLSFLMLCIITGASLLSVYTIFSFFSVYLFSIALTHSAAFSPAGSLLDQAVLLAIGIAMLLALFIQRLKKRITPTIFLVAVPLLLMLFAEGTTVLRLLTTQKVLFLPFVTGFQVGFATISQDTARLLQSFLLGSGPGTFTIDFSRFKPLSFNQYNDLWFLSFSTSTSLLLELLATTGIFGLISILILMGVGVKEYKKNVLNPFGVGMLVAIVSIITLPISFAPLAYFFILLSLTGIANRVHSPSHSQHEVEVSLVTRSNQKFSFSVVLPSVLLLLGTVLTIVAAYFSFNYIRSDLAFQESIVAANANNGSVAYKKQVEALTEYQYSDTYQRVFSQTSLALANSLLSLSASKTASPSQQTKDQALQLIQQSISTARGAISLSPLSASNWQNLGTIYRTLIGVGQGSDTFAIQAWQQAQSLDPTNPQEFLALGGVYYQLSQWDNAIREFQIALSLKSDYPNAYYNLGHAYEAKGDLTNALKQYQTVAQLVKADQSNEKQITAEIATVQEKMKNGQTTAPEQKTTPVSSAPQQTLTAPATQPTPAITGTPIPLPTAAK